MNESYIFKKFIDFFSYLKLVILWKFINQKN